MNVHVYIWSLFLVWKVRLMSGRVLTSDRVKEPGELFTRGPFPRVGPTRSHVCARVGRRGNEAGEGLCKTPHAIWAAVTGSPQPSKLPLPVPCGCIWMDRCNTSAEMWSFPGDCGGRDVLTSSFPGTFGWNITAAGDLWLHFSQWETP